MTALPVEAALPDLLRALAAGPNAVLQAPPGAGKTTRVPLALEGAAWAQGRIVMLEPRRLAARGAAARMAETLGEAVGERVGLRMRGETRVGAATRIEVVTEGVLTRMLQADPGLTGVACVVFDEIHERSLAADLGLALCLEAQAALRPDLRLLAMSATLDAAPIAARMGGAPVVTAEGRMHPVETRWLDRPLGDRPKPAAAAEAALAAMAEHPGDALVFLPGAREIERALAAVRAAAPDGVDALALHGSLPAAAQRAALAPAAPGRRKLVAASAVAETSLTVPGVRIVVDAGLARRARVDPGSGMGRLVTERASRAEADQRRGRAGRTAPGVCLRLWTKGEAGAAPAFAPPEIATADLADLALHVAAWGAAGPADLPFLDQPPDAAYAAATALLRDLGALDAASRLTPHGARLAAMPTHPRLAHMIETAAPQDRATARALAALLSEADPLRAPGARAPEDMGLRLEALADPKGFARARGLALDRGALARAAQGWRRLGGGGGLDPAAAGRLLARAYPDRVAGRRPGAAPRYLLSGGKGARLAADAGLAAAPLLAVAETDGDPTEAAIRLAAPVSRAELEAAFTLEEHAAVAWSRRERAVTARRETRLGALALESRRLDDPDPEAVARALCDGVRDLGLERLPWAGAPARLRDRVRWAAAREPGAWPDWSERALLETLEDWLAPHLGGRRRADQLAEVPLHDALTAALGWEAARRLETAAPAAVKTPAGPTAAIDYGRATPTASVRAQALYGLDRHPAPGVALELLSPAGRPIALTLDLPAFWRAGWLDARRDMRGRYPRHDWPEKPWEAAASLRAKPRRQA